MGGNDDREQWAQVPGSGGELWASDAGEIATLDPAGGFDVLPRQMTQFGEPCISFKREGGGHKKVRLVAAMVLQAHGHLRVSGCRLGYRDGDVSNIALKNLSWERKGRPRAETLTMRRCLGKNCDADFMSWGSGNRLCPACINRMGRAGDGGLDSSGTGELPDEPVFDVVGNPHK